MENVGRRLPFGEDPVRLGNTGRGLCVLGGVLFVAGWIGAVWSVLTSDTEGVGNFKVLQLISLGSYVTLGSAALLLAGVAMRFVAVWIAERST